MSNPDAPHGFQPVRTVSGGPFTCQEFVKLVGNAHAIFRNDVAVHLTGSGSPKNSEGRIVGIVDTYTSFTPGTTLEAGILLNFAPASTASDHQVIINQDLVMEAQDNGAANNNDGTKNGLRDADGGQNVNLSKEETGTTFGSAAGRQGLSGEELDSATVATTNTLDFHLIELLQETEAQGGNAAGAFSRWLVTFNRHRNANQVAGA